MRSFLWFPLLFSSILLVTSESPSEPHPEPLEQDVDVSDQSEANHVKAVAEPQLPLFYSGPRRQASLRISPIECYSCVGCPKVTNDTPVKLCSYTSDLNKQNKCVTYVQKYDSTEWYVRGCSSDGHSCAELQSLYNSRPETMKLVSCTECEKDRCNKSCLSHSLSDVTIAFFVLITPLLTKYTLS